MKKVLVILLSLSFIASVASAELLVTANPIGTGQWAVLGAGLQDSNYGNISGYTLTTLGGYVGYGLMDMLDLYVNAAYGTMGGLPSGVEGSGTLAGLNLKYAVLQEAPVSVAIGAGLKALSVRIKNPLTDTTNSGTQISLGVGVSKLMAPFIPYGGVAYRSTSGDVGDATQLDATVGSAIAWSSQGAVFVEYTLQSITPKGGSNFSSGQIGLGVGYQL
ncbi:MAG: hypothetical protein JW782_04440 [Candidatus Saganbacteria bacterium]|nr:hypothetical protein [Candidatus Saganbacteria bacterium]